MENSPPTRVRYLVLAWLCAAAALAYVTRNSISVAETAVRTSLELDMIQMGSALGAFFWAYAFLQVPTGWLSHVWGSRRALTVFSVFGSVTTVLFALASGYWSLWIARFSMGLAQAGLFPAATNTLARWFPTTQRGLASGVLTCCMSIGGALGNIMTAELLEWTTWQVVFYLFALPTLLWAVLFWWWFRERPEEHRSVNAAEVDFIREGRGAEHTPATVATAEPTPWLAILTSRAMFWISAQQFFRAAGYIFFTTWFATYLKETRDVSDRLAGYLNSIPLLGVVVGSFVGGILSDWLVARTGSRRVGRQALAIGTHLACALLILVGYRIADPWAAVLVISAAAMIGSFGAPCAYAITMDMGGKYIPPVFSLMNMCGNLGAAIFPEVVGRMQETYKNWDYVMLVFVGIYAAAALCWIPFNANGTIVRERPAV